jgi:hypothetical protein
MSKNEISPMTRALFLGMSVEELNNLYRELWMEWYLDPLPREIDFPRPVVLEFIQRHYVWRAASRSWARNPRREEELGIKLGTRGKATTR